MIDVTDSKVNENFDRRRGGYSSRRDRHLCQRDLGFLRQRPFKAIAEVVPGRPREKEEDRRAKGARSHGSNSLVCRFFVVPVVLHLHVVASPSGKGWRSQAKNNHIRWTGEEATKKTVKAVDCWRRQEAETAPSV